MIWFLIPQAADPSVFAVPSAGVSGSARASINTRLRTIDFLFTCKLISRLAPGQNQGEGGLSQGQGLKSQPIQSELLSISNFSFSLTPIFPSRVKVLYDYEAQDLDELTIKEGDLIDLVKEGLALCPPHPNSFLLR